MQMVSSTQSLGSKVTFFLKACPRCNGDLVKERDRSGKNIFIEVSCISCGYRKDYDEFKFEKKVLDLVEEFTNER